MHNSRPDKLIACVVENGDETVINNVNLGLSL
jgi:hypothetical protein